MKLDDVVKAHDGKWENDVLTVKPGAYFVQVAKKINGKIELTDEGLRAFPELSGKVVKPPVVEPVVEEPVVEEPVAEEVTESNLDDDLAAALADEPEEAPKKKKHGLK